MKERGPVSTVIIVIVVARVLFICLSDEEPFNLELFFTLFLLFSLPTWMILGPNHFSRIVLGLMSIGWFERFASDAKSPQNSAAAVKFLGWVVLCLAYWLIEASY